MGDGEISGRIRIGGGPKNRRPWPRRFAQVPMYVYLANRGRFSSQIPASQSLPRLSKLAAVGSGSPILGAGRDNFGDSRCGS